MNAFDWNQITPVGHAWECPDCDRWTTLAEDAGFHAHTHKHKTPKLIKISEGVLNYFRKTAKQTSFLQSNPVEKIINNQEGDFTESEIELAEEIVRLNKITNIDYEIAQLRHLYKQMVNGEVKDNKSAAKYLLGPIIEKLENMTNNKNTDEEQPAYYMESKIINDGTLEKLDVELKKTAPLSYDAPSCGKSEFNMESRENVLDTIRNKKETFIGMGEVPPNYRKTVLVDNGSGLPIYIEESERNNDFNIGCEGLKKASTRLSNQESEGTKIAAEVRAEYQKPVDVTVRLCQGDIDLLKQQVFQPPTTAAERKYLLDLQRLTEKELAAHLVKIAVAKVVGDYARSLISPSV